MKKILSLMALFTFLAIPQGAFAWTYDGLGSLNPFTNFGRGFGNSECGCQVERCQRPKLSKCEKLHGYKIQRDEPCGYAAPIIVPMQNECSECHRAF